MKSLKLVSILFLHLADKVPKSLRMWIMESGPQVK